MDVNKLLKALDDETNENLLDFTSKKMKEMNFKIMVKGKVNEAEKIQQMQHNT